jgi:N-acetylglucosaminyl-diphospho-decaprenol L-rhamnosyltransferase
MRRAPPDVSIIIVSWNTRDLLLQCLQSLPAAVGDLQADVWVVDNASTDGSMAAVRQQFPTVQVIENKTNVGFAAANNQAIVRSSGRYALLLNSDTIAFPNSIERLVRFADRHPRAGVVGPLLVNPDGSFQGSFTDFPSLLNETLNVTGIGRRLYGRWYPNYGSRFAQHPRRVDVIQGACMLARREAFAQVGLMDEAYFMYSEETDWCYRMARSGWELWFTPDATIRHYGAQSTRQMRQAMVKALYRSKIRFFRKHYGLLPALVLQCIFVIALRIKWLCAWIAAQRRKTAATSAIGWSELGTGGTNSQ